MVGCTCARNVIYAKVNIVINMKIGFTYYDRIGTHYHIIHNK